MTSKTPESPRVDESSDAVARRISIVDVRLMRLSAELISAQMTPPMKTLTKLSKTGFERQEGRRRRGDLVIYDLTYDVSAADSEKRAIWKVSFTLGLSFRLLDDLLGDDDLENFGVGVVDIAHPYARELVHHMTARMRVPGFILEVLPSLLEWPDQPRPAS